jgi:hypothetical protein
VSRKGSAAVPLLVTVLLLLGAGGASAGSLQAPQERLLPRAGSRIIVQPAAVGVVGEAVLRSARLTVRDGCGRTLRTGAAGLDGAGAAVPLPAQDAGPGTWEVTWSTRDAGGHARGGRWTFEVVEGTPCPSAGAAAPSPGTGGHHDPAAAPGAGTAGTPSTGPPLAPVLAGLVALLVIATALVLALRRHGRELAVVVAAHALVIALAGGLSPVGVAFAVPAAALVAGSVVATAVVAVPGLARRALLAGLVAGAAAGGAAALWAYGRAAVLTTPLDDALAAAPRQAAATAVAAAVLCAGGWYGTRSSRGVSD